MIIYKTESEIESSILEGLSSIGVLDVWDSPMLATLQGPFIGELEEVHNNIRDLDIQTRLSSARGIYLEMKAEETAGLSRINLLPPEDLTYSNFHFTIPDGKTAAAITVNGTGFTIPSGIIISNGVYEFETLDQAIFEPTSNTVYVRIRGTVPNMPDITEGTLTQHNIIYTTIANLDVANSDVTIECANDKIINADTYNESDDELRFRIRETILGRSGINENTLRAKLREIGIDNYVIHNDFYGVGRAGIELITNNPIVPDPLIVIANERVKEIYPGNRVIRPYYLMVKLTIDVELVDPAAASTTEEKIKGDIITLFNEYKLGTILDINSINTAIQNIDNVKDGECSCIFINGYRSTLTNQRCQPDEKFALDVDETDNIVFAIRT